jgi:hypothetical protein
MWESGDTTQKKLTEILWVEDGVNEVWSSDMMWSVFSQWWKKFG